MTEQTNPDAGVSMEDAVSQLMAVEEQPEGQAQAPQGNESSEQEQQPDGQAQATEESPASETEDAQEQPAVEDRAYRIVHQGQEIPLSLPELIENAQQGYDYTRKNQALAEKSRHVEDRLQRISQVEQIIPHIQSHLAQVSALESQLAPYQQVDWVQLAQDPQAYAQHQAQYLTLQQAHQRATAQLQQAYGTAQQQVGTMRQQQLAQEDASLPSYIPEWKDVAKKEAGKAELLKWLQGQGITPQAADAKLDSAVSVAIAYKAMRYDQLMRSKSDKSKTLRQAPPVTVPGSRATSSAQADKLKQAEQRLRKTGSMDDAVAVLLNRQGKGSS